MSLLLSLLGDTNVDAILGADEWISGQYYDFTARWQGASTGAVACTADNLYTTPLWVPKTRSIDRIGINITTQASAGNKARLGIYRKAVGSPLPGALLLDAGEVAVDAATAVAATVALVLPGPALYHVALVPQANISITGVTPVGGIYGAAAGGTDLQRISAVMSHAYAALPATFTVGSYSTAGRRVLVRAV